MTEFVGSWVLGMQGAFLLLEFMFVYWRLGIIRRMKPGYNGYQVWNMGL